MGTDLNTRYHASLEDEVMAILRTEGGWLGSHALLQRCELARNGDQLGDVLSKLVKRGELQRHCGDVGLLYAVMGLTPPTNTPQPGPSRLLSISQLSASNGEAAKIKREADARAAPTPRTSPRDQVLIEMSHCRARMLAMFRDQPLRACKDFQIEFKRSQPIVSGWLRAMVDDGLIEKVGASTASRFRLIEAPAAAPQPAADAAPAQPDTIEAPSVRESAQTSLPPTPAASDAAPSCTHEHWLELRQKLVALFHAQPVRRSAELAEALGKHVNSVSMYLCKLEDEGVVQRHSAGKGTYFTWIGRTPEVKAAASVAALPNPHSTNAVSAVVECNAEAMFGFWSNGDFEIRAQGQTIVLKGDVSRQLISFANRLEVLA